MSKDLFVSSADNGSVFVRTFRTRLFYLALVQAGRIVLRIQSAESAYSL